MQFGPRWCILFLTLVSIAVLAEIDHSKRGPNKLDTLSRLSMPMDKASTKATGLSLTVLKEVQTPIESLHGNTLKDGAISKEDSTKIKGVRLGSTTTTFGSMKLGLTSDKDGKTAEQPSIKASQKSARTCDKLDARKPWSKASKVERRDYLQAINCTFHKPGQFTYNEYRSRNLLEDYALVHNYLAPFIHNGGPFLPCHRQFVNVWIKALRNQCGYSGPILYADWHTYADRNEVFTSDELWSAEYFGTLDCPVAEEGFNGKHRFRYRGSVIMNQADLEYFPHNVCRRLSKFNSEGQRYEEYLQSDTLKEIMDKVTYNDFRDKLEHWYHDSVHKGIGGDMRRNTSPYDAIVFFLHHIHIDCIWWSWQEKDGGRHRDDYDGTHRDSNARVNLKDGCPMLGLGGPNVPVMDLMHADESPNCFTCMSL